MDIESRYFRTAILLVFAFLVLGIPLFKLLKGIFLGIKDGLTDPYKEERAENTKLWDDLFKKDWGFKFIEGDLDGYPDADILFEFNHSLSKHEQEELKQIFTDWYNRGSEEKNKEGSEFVGLMHFMHDKPKLQDKYGYFGFDFGTVGIERALPDLLQKLSQWNKGKIKKIVFGHDKQIFNNLFPSDK